jgi:hypothetical protein
LNRRLDGTPDGLDIVEKKTISVPDGNRTPITRLVNCNPQDPRQKDRYMNQDSNTWLSVLTPCQKNKVLISYSACCRDAYDHQQVAGETKASAFGSTVCKLTSFPGIPLAFPRDRVAGCMIISYLTHKKRVAHHCNNRRLHVICSTSPAKKRSKQLKISCEDVSTTHGQGKSDSKRRR